MSIEKKDDHVLVNDFINGDAQAIEILINRHKNRVFTYILLIVKDEQLAEDIFQDTFIKVIRSLRKGKYLDKGIFVSWVVRIAHNLVIDYFRKSKNINNYSKDNENFEVLNSIRFAESTIEDEMIQTQISEDLKNLVLQLPKEQREVILLRHYGELSFKEISEQTGVSINTALGRMRYALINLRKMIEEKKLTLTAI